MHTHRYTFSHILCAKNDRLGLLDYKECGLCLNNFEAYLSNLGGERMVCYKYDRLQPSNYQKYLFISEVV